MAQDVLEQVKLDRIVFVPNHRPPHKSRDDGVDADHRKAMLELAIREDERFAYGGWELERKGISYSIDTVRALQAEYPQARIYFIIGSDSWLSLHTWKDIVHLFACCTFVTVVRPGCNPGDMTAERVKLAQGDLDRLKKNIISGHALEISSSDIRARVRQGLRIRYLVPRAVEAYIYKYKLYC